jgi:hypothetical protein
MGVTKARTAFYRVFALSNLNPIAPISFRAVERAIGTSEGRILVTIAGSYGCYTNANRQGNGFPFPHKRGRRYDLTETLCRRLGRHRISARQNDSKFLSA